MFSGKVNLQNPVVLYWDSIAAITVAKCFYLYMNNMNFVK